MRKIVVTIFALLILLLPASALAGKFYEHEDSNYYWYVEDTPHYEVVIPSTAQGYLDKSLFGQKVLDIYFGSDGPQMVVGSIVSPSVTTDKIRAMAIAQWGHIFTNAKVEADRMITTSNGTSAYFYAATASTPSSKQGMLRLVVFQKGSRFAYLTLSCYSSDWNNNAAMRNQWLIAVNDFSWLD